MLDWRHSISYERHSWTHTSAAAGIIELSRTERAYLRGLWRQARRVLLQSRRRQPARGLGGPQLLSLTLFSCGHVFERIWREHPLPLSPFSRSCRVSRKLSPYQRNSPARKRLDRQLA